MVTILSVKELLQKNLVIPSYQRPYKWQLRNIEELLSDIEKSISEYERYNHNFKYRIGSVILFENNGCYEIVDGQQRILSLVLLSLYLNQKVSKSILNMDFLSKITQNNLHKNYRFIKEWFVLKKNLVPKFIQALEKIIEMVIIPVESISEAFQLFDSQNNRGKPLVPHDLLKAYHLREMKNHPYEMEHAVTRWEEKDTEKIKELFDLYLFPIWNWSRGNKTKTFTANEIDTYKGITEKYDYTYARRANRSMPFFQITDPFISGNDFFAMVDHYLNLIRDVKKEIISNPNFKKMLDIISFGKDISTVDALDNLRSGSTGFDYAKNLFFCSIFCYYDKFHNFDERAIQKLFTWAFAIRVDMENLGYDTINKYSIGELNDHYSNIIPMFAKINLARLHNEIANLYIEIYEPPSNANKLRKDLYQNLLEFNSLGE